MYIWSSLLPRYTQKDSIEISFIFFGALLYFLRILEVYMIFWNSKRKNEKMKTDTQCWASFGPRPRGNVLAQKAEMARPAQLVAWRACAPAAITAPRA
jgi:hypothetical protein